MSNVVQDINTAITDTQNLIASLTAALGTAQQTLASLQAGATALSGPAATPATGQST
jgi:prefoldin subunit 5